MLMKWSKARALLALGVYVFAMTASLLLPSLAQPAQASVVQPDWVFVYPTDKQVLATMNTALNTAGGLGFSAGLSQSYVLNKNTLWNPAGFRKFSFNGTNSKLAATRWYAFTTTYYCANNKVIKTKPADDDYSFVELQVNMNLKGGFAEARPHETTLTVARFHHFNSAGNGVDYDADNASKTGTLAQVARFSGCFPSETVLRTPPTAANLFAVRNLTDPAVNDATWRDAKTKVQNQSDVENIPNTDTSGGGSGAGTGSAGTDEAAADQCPRSAFNFGWLICPFLGIVNDLFVRSFQRLVFSALSVDPLDPTGPDKNIYLVWKNIRDLANVLFLFIFMVVVLANTLSFNVQAYTIKKMIPKLVAAAILVQFSFVISAVIIDIGNILGNGIADLINSVANIPGEQGGGGVGKLLANMAAGITAVIGGGAFLVSAVTTTGATVGVAIGAIILVALTAFFAFVSIIFTLVLRKLIIVILIIISPLAFAAMVLPSTEKFFKIWMKTFIQVIMMYPIIVFMFAAATVLQQAVGGSGSGTSVNDDLGIVKLMAAAMPIAACFMVPMAFKWGGKIMSGGSNQLDSLIRGKLGGKVVGGFKDSDAYKTPRALREGNKLEKKQRYASMTGDLPLHKHPYQKWQRYKAGVSLRGDYLGANRTLAYDKDKKGLNKFKVDEYGDMKRKQIRDRADYLNAGLANSVLDRQHLMGLLNPMTKGIKQGNFDDINPMYYDQVMNGIGSYIKKEGKLPYADALEDLTAMGNAMGKTPDDIREDQEFLMGIDHGAAKAMPFAAETTHETTLADRHEMDQNGELVQAKVEGTTQPRKVKVLATKKRILDKDDPDHGKLVADQDSHEWHDLQAAFGQDTFMGEHKDVGIDQLVHGQVEDVKIDPTTKQVVKDSRGNPETYKVRAMDKLLANDKLLLHNLHTTGTRYGQVRSEAKAAVVDYGKKALARADTLRKREAAQGGTLTDAAEREELQFIKDNKLEAAYRFAAHFGDDINTYNQSIQNGTNADLQQALKDAGA